MKADIPDKILINRGEDGKLHHSYWTTDQELIPFEDTIYVRKDALIEMLKGYRHPLTRVVARELIDKINEL